MTEPDVYKNTETLDHSYIAGGIENNIAILENSLAALLIKKKKKKKGEHVITTWPSSCTPGHLSQRIENLRSRENLCINVHSSFIHNSHKQYKLDVLHQIKTLIAMWQPGLTWGELCWVEKPDP